jgi:hypothetical protein
VEGNAPVVHVDPSTDVAQIVDDVIAQNLSPFQAIADHPDDAGSVLELVQVTPSGEVRQKFLFD